MVPSAGAAARQVSNLSNFFETDFFYVSKMCSELYSDAVDVWSLGCVFYEMATGLPLLPCDSEIGQLFLIFRLRGTPHEPTNKRARAGHGDVKDDCSSPCTAWPGVSALAGFNASFPKWGPRKAEEVLESFAGDVHALDLFFRMLRPDPSRRISARRALGHAYFNDRASGSHQQPALHG